MAQGDDEAEKVSRFAGRILGTILSTTLDAAISNVLLPADRSHVERMVELDITPIDVLQYLWFEYEMGLSVRWKPQNKMKFGLMMRAISMARHAAKKTPNIREYINEKSIAGYITKKRPDLGEALASDSGKAWTSKLASQVVQLMIGSLDGQNEERIRDFVMIMRTGGVPNG